MFGNPDEKFFLMFNILNIYIPCSIHAMKTGEKHFASNKEHICFISEKSHVVQTKMKF